MRLMSGREGLISVRSYGIPINRTEKQKYMVPLYEAAKEFERLEQKETDYELLLQLNGSESISSEISKNLTCFQEPHNR